MDAELSDLEAQSVRDHLEGCAKCHREYQTLCETKRLVASLAVRAPRTDLEELLRAGLQQSAPPTLRERVAYWWEERVSSSEQLQVRPHVLAATALFSLAGLWLATVTLDGPHDRRPMPMADFRQTPLVRFVRIEYSKGHFRFSTGVMSPTVGGSAYVHALDDMSGSSGLSDPGARTPASTLSGQFIPLPQTPVSFGSYSPTTVYSPVSLISDQEAIWR